MDSGVVEPRVASEIRVFVFLNDSTADFCVFEDFRIFAVSRFGILFFQNRLPFLYKCPSTFTIEFPTQIL